MKLQLTLALATLAALGASSAQANVSFGLDSNLINYTGPDTMVGGWINNDSNSELVLGTLNFTVPTGMGIDDVFNDPNIGDAGTTLPAHSVYHSDSLFGILGLPSGPGPFTGDVQLTDDSLNPNTLGAARFTVIASPVPEPGSVALLVGSGLSGLFLLRRRRK